MLRKFFTVAVLGLSSSAALFAAGCASSSSDKPYGLTGNNTISEEERTEQRRWTDDKGHYRPDLRMRGGPPLRHIP